MDIESRLKSQRQLAESIERLLTNFGKDGPSRKTIQYLAQRKDDLCTYWDLFTQNHSELKAYIKSDHPYLTQSLFEKTQDLFNKALGAICSYEQKVASQAASISTTAATSCTTASEIPTLSKIGSITTTTITTSSTTSSGISTLAEAGVPSTTSAYQAFTLPSPSITSQLNTWGSMQPTAAFPYVEANRASNFPKLPPIKIPKFTGDYKEWKPFIDIFTNVIHNNPYLSRVEKMQYLLYHLEGDARRVISHLQLSDGNYNTALQLIQARINNSRRIITTYINTIMDAKKVEYRSQENIIMLFDVIRECLEALKTLNCHTDAWGPMIVCTAIRKLDPESLRLFEESLSNSKEMPPTAELLNFLEKRYQVLDCIRSSKQMKADIPHNNKKKTFHVATRRSCVSAAKTTIIYIIA